MISKIDYHSSCVEGTKKIAQMEISVCTPYNELEKMFSRERSVSSQNLHSSPRGCGLRGTEKSRGFLIKERFSPCERNSLKTEHAGCNKGGGFAPSFPG